MGRMVPIIHSAQTVRYSEFISHVRSDNLQNRSNTFMNQTLKSLASGKIP